MTFARQLITPPLTSNSALDSVACQNSPSDICLQKSNKSIFALWYDTRR